MFGSMKIENNFPRIPLDVQRSLAPGLPHEVRVRNHLMLCSFSQQNQHMIFRGLKVFCRESRWSRWVCHGVSKTWGHQSSTGFQRKFKINLYIVRCLRKVPEFETPTMYNANTGLTIIVGVAILKFWAGFPKFSIPACMVHIGEVLQ